MVTAGQSYFTSKYQALAARVHSFHTGGIVHYLPDPDPFERTFDYFNPFGRMAKETKGSDGL
jgi:hypothetical protein